MTADIHAHEKWIKFTLDKFILCWYCIFAFVALAFEPLYYFGCSWNGLDCPLAKTNQIIYYVKEMWLLYCLWDPMFYSVPLWLRVLCSIEVFLFGPLYVLTVIGLVYDSDWIYPLALVFGGALVYSTFVYFIMEIIENIEGTNFLVVFLVNVPWTILPLLLIYQVVQKSSNKSQSRKKTS
jgi:hypothetical protein